MAKSKNLKSNSLFLFLLFGIYTLTSVVVLITGVKIYRSITKTSEENVTARNVASYIANKIRYSDFEDGVNVTQEDGKTVLVLKHQGQTVDFYTLMYFHDNNLCEQTVLFSDGYDSSLSDPVLPLNYFNVQKEGKKLTFEIMDNKGNTENFTVSLRSENINDE